jgi:carbonic anhydrase
MNGDVFLRREFALAAACAALAAGEARGEAAEQQPVEDPYPKNAEEALARLKEGNRRFAQGKVRHAHEAADWRKQLMAGQRPIATILGCSDSRVPVELVFDQGFGDLFVIRVAGNVISDETIGSIGYALRHLKTPLLVIMGHEGCGAVSAALDALSGDALQAKYIQSLVRHIEPAVKRLDAKLEGEARLSAAVEANVRWSAEQLSRLPEAEPFRREKLVTMVRAVYDLKTGTVRFLE